MTPINLDEDFTREELEKIRDAFYLIRKGRYLN